MDTNLGNIIASAKARAIIYSTYVIAGILIGATQVGFAAIAGAGQPEWLTIALAVYAFLSVPLGSLALSNTSTGTPVAETIVYEGHGK